VCIKHYNAKESYFEPPTDAQLNMCLRLVWIVIVLFSVNFSDLLQQIHKNCNNKGEERLTQYADADDGVDIANKINGSLV